MPSSDSHAYRPVIILGAGRSGTNMLRDVLCRLPDYGTWPCDEINYIWRHGNKRYPSDTFPSTLARPKVRAFLDRAFRSCARRTSCSNVVEKTCANTLRAGFVAAALPDDALFLHIVRDGSDVVTSAAKRWKAKLDIPYLMRKARFVPPIDLPYYAARYLGARIYRLFDHEGRLSFWGPRYPGLEEDLKTLSLPEVCAWQWRHCVERSLEDLGALGEERVLHLRYEDFVNAPDAQLQRIGGFLGEDWSEGQRQAAVAAVSRGSVGKARREASAEHESAIASILQPLLDRLADDTRFR